MPNRPALLAAALTVAAGLTVVVGQTQPTTQPTSQPATRPARTFAHPDRLRYDGQCFTIDGKDLVLYSGAFHYFRCPKELWNDRFDRIKAAGFNAVETYVAWNQSEPAMPTSVDDYSKADLKDLDDWLTMAEAHGLYVILRPGPYICAEWDCGGFPQWLLTKKPADWDRPNGWLRSDEPTFVAWSKHWYHAVDQVAAKHQLTRRRPGEGGIVLYQLENEYGGNEPDEVEVRYLHALGQQAIDDGIDVPLFTCWTGVVRTTDDPVVRQAFDSCNFYPGWGVDGVAGEIRKLRRQQPDAPLMTTELQGGWFGNVGAAGSITKDWTSFAGAYTPAQIQNLTLFAWQNGETATNYYMLFGGTNFGDFAPHGITTTYDYSAPIRELGGVGERYQRVAALGAMLREHGPRLARSVGVRCEAKAETDDVTVAARWSPDGSLYFFVRTKQHELPRKGRADVDFGGDVLGDVMVDKGHLTIDYDLEPFGSKVLYYPPGSAATDGQASRWLPEPAPAIPRPAAADLPTTVPITQVMRRDDAGPTEWRKLEPGQTLEQLGVYDRRFVFYRGHGRKPLDKAIHEPVVLRATGPSRDAAGLWINGRRDPAFELNRAAAVDPLLATGDNELTLLYENTGQPNGGRGMEEMSGVRSVVLAPTSAAADGAMTGWRTSKMDAAAKPWTRAEQLPEVAADADDQHWAAATVPGEDERATQLATDEVAVFRATVDVTPEQLAAGNLALSVGRMDDHGWAFVNGKKVGEGHDWAANYAFPAAAALHVGRNTVAILVRNVDGRGGLANVRLTSGTAAGLPLEVGLASAGFAGQWWKPDLDAAGWTAAKVGDATPTDAPLTWHRMAFALPAPKPHVWTPWVARLALSGNGFLYLNGHPLGRYWNAGPQHDFFLPECWLKFDGSANVLTTCLRPVGDAAAGVAAAAVVPVTELAEIRP